jgi:hypothetical protein
MAAVLNQAPEVPFSQSHFTPGPSPFPVSSATLSIIMGVQIPDLQFTSLKAIPELISVIRKSFLEHKTRDVEFRLVQLRKLYWA